MTRMFSRLSSRAQVARLKVFALEILERYGLQNSKLKLLSHGYNTFFRVDANGQKYDQNREAFKRGYISSRPWLPEYDSVIETLIAGRSLVLANDVVQSLNPEWHEIAPRFFERSEKRLRNFLESGQSTLN